MSRILAESFLAVLDTVIETHKAIIQTEDVNNPFSTLGELNQILRNRVGLGQLHAYGLIFAGMGFLHYYDSMLDESVMQGEVRRDLELLRKQMNEFVDELLNDTRPAMGSKQ